MNARLVEVYKNGQIIGIQKMVDEALGGEFLRNAVDVEDKTEEGESFGQYVETRFGRVMTSTISQQQKNPEALLMNVTVLFAFGRRDTARLNVYFTRPVSDDGKWTMSFSRETGGKNWVVFTERQIQFLTAVGLVPGRCLQVSDVRACAIMSELVDRIR